MIVSAFNVDFGRDRRQNPLVPFKKLKWFFYTCYVLYITHWFLSSSRIKVKDSWITTICVHPWSVTNFAWSFTFQTLTVCLVMYHFWTMKRWRLCCEIDNVFDSIPACFIYVLSKFSVFCESVRVLHDRPNNVSARFTMETKKCKVNKFRMRY